MMAFQLTSDFVTRSVLSALMISGLIAAILYGHISIIITLATIQLTAVQEVLGLINVASETKGIRHTKTLNWYFFCIVMYFLYGESLGYYFEHVARETTASTPLAIHHHRFISFMLYIFGFIFFVRTLQEEHLKDQFAQFAWSHLAFFLIVIPGHFSINSLLDGMIWFLLPSSLVIVNDIFAYLCGKTFGRTQLIKLSPKKTVEGFYGAWLFTVISGFLITKLLLQSSYFTCPCNDLGASYWTGLDCPVNPVFVPQTYTIPILPHPYDTITIEPIQIHAVVLATFASLVAPWGGFFASGIKRTLKIKDFGNSIPGHGGITDRVDCQLVMTTLAFLYYQAFIFSSRVSPGDIVHTVISKLSLEDQFQVVQAITSNIAKHGVAVM